MLRRLAGPWRWIAVGLLATHALVHGWLQSRPGQPAIVVFAVVPPLLFGLSVVTLAAAVRDLLYGGWRRLFRGSLVFPMGALIASFLLSLLTYQVYPSSYADRPVSWCLALPFDGEIAVLQGGLNADVNDHVAVPSERYGYDLAPLRSGVTAGADAWSVTDPFTPGAVVLAPIEGVVVGLAGDLPEPPSRATGWRPWRTANTPQFVLQVDEGQYLFLSRLERGSITVRVGDRVLAGTPLGRVGRAGRGAEPHLHLHLQDHEVPGRGEAIPVGFCAYDAIAWGDGWETARRVERGLPTGRDRRQVLRAAE